MVKLLYFVKRNKNMTHEECVRHHREVHVPLVLSVWKAKKDVAPKRYVAYYLEEAPELLYDMLIEQWFQDEEHWKKMGALRGTPEYARIVQDNEIMTDVGMSKVVSARFDQNVVI